MIWQELTQAEDEQVWAMRAEDVPFPQIAAEIEDQRKRAAAKAAAVSTRWAKHHREILRRERSA